MKKNIMIIGTLGILLVGCGKIYKSKEELGKDLFFDKSLSLTKQTSCATCHDPDHAFIDARHMLPGAHHVVDGALSIGDDGVSLGGRNAPTVAYAKFSPEFNVTSLKGGQFYDGRASTLKDQAMGPPLDKAEMMMPNKESFVRRIKENPSYLLAFKTFYGLNMYDTADKIYEAFGDVIEKYEQTDEFSPFDSKYDRYLQGKYVLSKKEEKGMNIFFSKEKSNCKKCHTLKKTSNEKRETFTNYKYHNIGTPRNLKALEARFVNGQAKLNATDHGLLGNKLVTDKAQDGKVKIPTLRNIAITGPYMSNGVFNNLSTVLAFYDHMGGENRRPYNPETGELWEKPIVKETINHKALKMPALSDEDLEDLEAFLRILTDKRYEHLLKK